MTAVGPAMASQVSGHDNVMEPHRLIKVYFSVIQRKLLTPGDFESLDELAAQILAFEKPYNAAARPFDWRFTRTDLNQLLARIRQHDRHATHPQAA